MELFLIKRCLDSDFETQQYEDLIGYRDGSGSREKRTDVNIISRIKEQSDPAIKPYMVVKLPDETTDFILVDDTEGITNDWGEWEGDLLICEHIYYVVNGKIFQYNPYYELEDLSFKDLTK